MVFVDSQVFTFRNGFSPIIVSILIVVTLISTFFIIKTIRKRRQKKKEKCDEAKIKDESDKVMDRLKLVINKDYNAIECERRNRYLRNISENAKREAEKEEQAKIQKENKEIAESLNSLDKDGIEAVKNELIKLDYESFTKLPDPLKSVLNNGTLLVIDNKKMYYFDTKDLDVAIPDLEVSIGGTDVSVPVVEEMDGNEIHFKALGKLII